MDQESSELNRIDNDRLEAIENPESATGSIGLTQPRVATASDAAESERAVASDLQTIDDARTSDDTAAAVDTTAEPEQIREQIEQTRSQLSETINAIEEKLSFSNIQEQVSEQINSAVETAKDAVYEATLGKAGNFMKTVTKGLNNVSESFGDAGDYVVKSAKRNPLPLALIGLGVGMLLMQNTRSTTHRYEYDDNRRRGGHGGGGRQNNDSTLRRFADAGSGALSSAQQTVSSAAGSAYESVSGAASTAYDSVSGAAGSAYQGVSGAASSAYQGVSRFASSTGGQVQQAARKAQHTYERTLEENPLAIGAIAVALGAIVGLAIPSTEYENQWMGEHKETLVQSVEEAARGALERVQEVAGEVTSQVQDQMQSGGDSGSSSASAGGSSSPGSASTGGAGSRNIS